MATPLWKTRFYTELDRMRESVGQVKRGIEDLQETLNSYEGIRSRHLYDSLDKLATQVYVRAVRLTNIAFVVKPSTDPADAEARIDRFIKGEPRFYENNPDLETDVKRLKTLLRDEG